MDHSKLISNALEFGATQNGYNMKKVREYLALYSPDKRCRLHAVYGTAGWAYNEHGRVKYAGCFYDYEQTPTGYNVKLVGGAKDEHSY